MTLKKLLALSVFLFFIACNTASARELVNKVHFPKGKSSTTISGTVVRGDSDKYILGAKAGQKMDVEISAIEKNAAFQIYKPKSEETLKGAGEEEDAKKWSGTLPVSGDYAIVVGGTRGNATYKLRITIY